MWFLLVVVYIIVRLFISEYKKEKAAAYAKEVNKNYKPCYFDEKKYRDYLDRICSFDNPTNANKNDK